MRARPRLAVACATRVDLDKGLRYEVLLRSLVGYLPKHVLLLIHFSVVVLFGSLNEV